MIFLSLNISDASSTASEDCEYIVRRGNTDIGLKSRQYWAAGAGSGIWQRSHPVYIDAPLTTDTTVYYLYMREANNGASSGLCGLVGGTYENSIITVEFP